VVVLYVFAALLLLVGGTIVTFHALRKPWPVAFLVDRGIDPHLWGFHFMGAGFLLSLLLMILRDTPWSRQGWAERVIVIVSFAWVIAAILISTVAVLARDCAGAPRLLLPSPDAKLATWPGPYRAFIAIGFAALGALAVIAFQP
jgi:hypothetical protein